jgi:succinyl-diaminopimelate desuccinylase
MRHQVLEEIAARRGELEDLCSACVRIPGINPPGNTTEIAAFARAYLERLGIAVDVYEPLPGAPNLVASIGRAGARPGLVVNGHLDTFPAAEGEWRHGDPFSGGQFDGRIYGCGSSDMRGGVAAILFAAAILKAREQELPGRVTLTLVSDEETGGRWGTRWLLENVEEVQARACLNADQCGPDLVAIGEKGMVFLTLSTSGRSSHAAYGNAESANHRLLKILTALRELERLEDVTVNVGHLEGGVSPNLVSESAHARIDIRVPPGLNTDRLLAEVDAAVAGTGEDCTIKVDLLSEPNATAVDDPLVTEVMEASRLATGRAPRAFTRVGASDARLFRAAGMPTVVYGPAANNMGSPDEFVSCDDLLATAQVHAVVMLATLEKDA